MRDLALRLIDESRRRWPDNGNEGNRPAAPLDLLYERLRPVIGSRGFHALFVRSMRRLGERRPSVATVATCQTMDQGLKELHQALRTDAAEGEERDAVVLELLESLLGTLERMIGPELTRRLSAHEEGPPTGGDDG